MNNVKELTQKFNLYDILPISKKPTDKKLIDKDNIIKVQQQISFDAEMKSMNKKLSEMAFNVTDPVLFALPKDIDVNDFNHDVMYGFVGPVWGPDFDGVALYKLDMEIIKNQRNILNNTLTQIWS